MKVIFDIDGTLAQFLLVGPDVWSKEGYAETLPVMQNMVGAAKILAKHASIYSASAAIDKPWSIPNKGAWLDREVPEIKKENRVYTKYGEDKSAIIGQAIDIEPGDVFIDDYTPNLIDMQKAFPSLTCVKVLNGINDTNKTWKGARISADSSPEAIAMQILGLSLAAKAMAA